MLAFSSPLASYGVDGATTLRPGEWMNQASGHWEWKGPACSRPPYGARLTTGAGAPGRGAGGRAGRLLSVDGPSSSKAPLEGLMRIGQGTLLRKIDRVFDLLEHPDLNRPHGFFRHLALAKGPLEALDGVFTAPLLEEFPRHVGGIIVFRMAPPTHGLTLDEGRPSATAGSRGGLRGRLVDGQDIVAVDDPCGKAVGLGPIGDMRDRHLSGEGDGVGQVDVMADEDDGESQDGGLVESLVEIAAARCAVTKIRDGDARLPSDLKGQRRACGHGDPIGHRADEGEDG